MTKNIKKITMYKTDWCADCFRADAFFDEFEIEVERINIDKAFKAEEKVIKINKGNRSVPTIVIEYEDKSKKILVEPSRDVLEQFFLDK